MDIVVVMPARDEATLIAAAIADVPDEVDWIIVVDDGSVDGTARLAQEQLGARGEVLRTAGVGVGGAIAEGSQHALTRRGVDCIVVIMAGDGQMDGADLPALVAPILAGRADHVKGNRWMHAEGPRGMPKVRRLGTWWLSHLTSLSCGQRVRDTQCGYTATSGAMLAAWDWSRTWRGYGYPNWWLMEAGRRGFVLEEAPVRSVYGEERSGIRLRPFLTSVSWMLWKGVWRRGWNWYVRGAETHPLRRLVATSLWFGGWASLGLAFWNPLALGIAPLAFLLLTGLDQKESRRRRGQVTA